MRREKPVQSHRKFKFEFAPVKMEWFVGNKGGMVSQSKVQSLDLRALVCCSWVCCSYCVSLQSYLLWSTGVKLNVFKSHPTKVVKANWKTPTLINCVHHLVFGIKIRWRHRWKNVFWFLTWFLMLWFNHVFDLQLFHCCCFSVCVGVLLGCQEASPRCLSIPRHILLITAPKARERTR